MSFQGESSSGSFADVVRSYDQNFSKENWGDVLSDDETIDVDDFESSTSKRDESTKCCPRVIDGDYLKVLSIFQDNFSKTIKLKDLSFECLANVIRNTVYCSLEIFERSEENTRVNILNEFLKFRHEVLAMCFGKLIGQTDHTDVSFNQKFGIDSNRTPDFIYEREGVTHILEVSAVTDIERGASMKGDVELGYISKYNPEIEILKSLGYQVEYTTLIFDISNFENRDTYTKIGNILKSQNVIYKKEQIEEIEFFRIEFCNCTRNMNKLYGKYYSSLYNVPFELPDFTLPPFFSSSPGDFTGSYSRVTVSNNIYDNVVRQWDRLEYMVYQENSKNIDSYYNLFFEITNSRFSLEKEVAKNREKEIPSNEISEISNMMSEKRYDYICQMITVKTSGAITKTVKPDFEYFEYLPKKNLSLKNFSGFEGVFEIHENSFEPESIGASLKNYEENLKENEFKKLKTVFEDKDYEKKIFDMIREKDFECSGDFDFADNLSPLPFCSYNVDRQMFTDSIENYKRKYFELNSEENSNIQKHCKPPFVLPIFKVSLDSYTNYKEKPKIISKLVKKSLGPFTDRIISIIHQDSFKFGTQKGTENFSRSENREKLQKLQKEICDLQKEEARKRNDKKSFPKLKEIDPDGNLKSELSRLHSLVRKESEKNKGELCIVKLPTKNNSDLHKDFKKEMEHFKSKKIPSLYKGVGLTPDFNNVRSSYVLLKNSLKSPAGVECPDDIYDDYVACDVPVLMDLKKDYLNEFKGFLKFLKGTFLFHSCAFISRLCHTLLYHSQTSINGDYICIDNLGYDDVLLLTKGGKKIFPTKKSKLFRLFFPTFSSCSELYKCSGLPSSYFTTEISGKLFLMTPWMNLHETVLTDGLTFLHRSMGFMTMSRQIELTDDENFEMCYFNVLLSFHNRRQTEVFLHNFRYLIMNCMSEFSSIKDILPELAGFNYDCFQFYVRECVVRNFYEFSSSLKKLHDLKKNERLRDELKKGELRHLFNENKITSLQQLSVAVYSTYLMSKAPTTQSLEQYKNLKSMMETHEEFENLGLGEDKNELFCSVDNKKMENYYEELMENDFKFDPKFCVLLGKFMNDYLGNLMTEGEVQTTWDNVLNKNWDLFSNTSGLRGTEKDDFFGQKGYYIVYKKVLKDNPGILGKLDELSSNDSKDMKLKSDLRKLNLTYRNSTNEAMKNEVVFHVVDKKQRAGNREIYVMDVNTKICQQTIEEFIGKICKQIPNEVISVPSNKRLSTIHTKVFEAQVMKGEPYYMVMDCRKWAPKSIVEKFSIFLSGMRGILPSSFLKHCYFFFDKMTRKRIYTKKHIYNMFCDNDATKKYIKNFVEDKEKGGYFFKMPYSWIMGIFNYFSSFMHVAAQLYISHVVRYSSSKNLNEQVFLGMVAHSDDSAGKANVPDRKNMKRLLFIYEVLMKASNHLISKKKSNSGKIYYEFLSILYIDGVLLSIVVKFSGMFNLHPSDEGYCSDINEAYSKCIELITNGSTFSQAYMGTKIQIDLIRKFYFGQKYERVMYNYPPKMLGIPDPHPFMVLLCGSDSDTVRLMNTLSVNDKKKMLFINKEIGKPNPNENAFLKSLPSKPNIRKGKQLVKILEENKDIVEKYKDDWVTRNVNFNNTAFSTLQFLIKLDDTSFISALQDETITRRLSRAYYFRKNETVETSAGPHTYKAILKSILMFEMKENDDLKKLYGDIQPAFENAWAKFENYDFSKEQDIFDFLFSEANKLYKYLSILKYKKENVIKNKKTTKPTHIKLIKTIESFPFKVNIASLSCWMKYPEKRLLLPDTRNLHSMDQYVTDLFRCMDKNIDDIYVEDLYLMLNKFSSKSDVEYYCYSNVPSQLREINTYQDSLNYIAHNSFPDSYIEGLTLQFGKTIGVIPSHILTEVGQADVQWTLIFCLMLNYLAKFNMFDEVLKLWFNLPVFLLEKTGFERERMLLTDLFIELKKYWGVNLEVYKFISLDFEITECLLFKRKLNGSIFKNSYYSSFLKSQFLIQNVWMGNANLYLSLGNKALNMVINNNNIISVYSKSEDMYFTNPEISYVNFCLKNSQIGYLVDHMREIEFEDLKNTFLGYDKFNTYRITEGQNLLKGIPVKIDYNLMTRFSNPEIGEVEVTKGGKIFWSYKRENENPERYKINTIKMDPVDVLDLLEDILTFDTVNQKIILNLEKDLRLEIMDYCISASNTEIKIKKETFLENYKSSKIYKILSSCKRNQLCTYNVSKIIDKKIPAQDGGILNMLIEYSKIEPDFNFNWNKVLTPSYLRLKSTQPESFVTSIIDNVEERYRIMFEDEDRGIIMRNIIKMSKFRNEEDYDEKMMQMLCGWGVIGVSGSLNLLKNEINVDSHRMMRVYDDNFHFLKMFHDAFISLLIAILTSGEKFFQKNVEMFSNSQMESWFVIKKSNYQSYVKTIVHHEMILLYTPRNKRGNFLETIDIMLVKIMNNIFRDKDSFHFFNKKIEKNGLLSQLQYGPEFISELKVTYNSLRSMYRRDKGIKKTLDLSKRLQNNLDIQTPYDKTKEILEMMNTKLNPKDFYRHGLLSEDYSRFLKSKRSAVMRNSLVHATFEIKNPINFQSIPFQLKIKLDHVLDEDFFDSDEWEEFEMEMMAIDVDEETVFDYIKKSDYVNNPSRKIKLSSKGKLITALAIEVTVLLNITGQNFSVFEKYRQSGENVVIVTDMISSFNYMNYRKGGWLILRSLIDPWMEKTITMTSKYIYLVRTNFDDVGFWENILNAKRISSDELKDIPLKDICSFRESNGNLYNPMNEDELKMVEMYNITNERVEKTMEELKEKNVKKKEVLTEFQKNVEKYLERKYDEKMIRSLLKSVENEEKGWEMIVSQLRNIMQNEKLKDELIGKTEQKVDEILRNPMTSKQHENIYQIPGIYGTSSRKESDKVKNLIGEPELMAEIESIAPGLLNKIISDKAGMSVKMKKRLKNRYKLLKKATKGLVKNKGGKSFTLNLMGLLVNDSNVYTDYDNVDDTVWQDLVDWVDDIFVEDDEDSEDEDVDLEIENEPDGSRLNYVRKITRKKNT